MGLVNDDIGIPSSCSAGKRIQAAKPIAWFSSNVSKRAAYIKPCRGQAEIQKSMRKTRLRTKRVGIPFLRGMACREVQGGQPVSRLPTDLEKKPAT